MALQKNLNILFVSSEMAPYAKTGGLADVTSALSGELMRRGHDVRVVLPFYDCVKKHARQTEVVLQTMGVKMGKGEEWCTVHQTKSDDGVPVVLIEHELYFNRPGLYHDDAMNDYRDNPRRFGFLSRAALQYCLDTGFKPDIVHAHDWQAALAPAYVKTWFWNDPQLSNAASVLTIHNIAYQGSYPAFPDYDYLGLGKENFTAQKFESMGAMNFLKGGIYYSDAVNTVSPTHAREITQPFGGFGLAPFLTDKGKYFCGILNGVDCSIWSPHSDPFIPAHFTPRDLQGKDACKRSLQCALNLNQDSHICLLAVVGRFVHQKGFQLIRDAIDPILNTMHTQFVILGDGDNKLEDFFNSLSKRFPGRASAHLGYSAELAHLIQAGADFFLMPSLFEPCGLTQMYSLRYGTLPIVRATGGLEDTVEQYDEKTGKGTGFKFMDATAQALYHTTGWAVATYYDRKPHMKKLIQQAMRKDFSWKKSVAEYEKLYESALQAKLEYNQRFSR